MGDANVLILLIAAALTDPARLMHRERRREEA